MRPIACANSAARMKLMHRIYALAQPSNRHPNFDDVREVAHDGLGARSALVACHALSREGLKFVSAAKNALPVLRCGHLSPKASLGTKASLSNPCKGQRSWTVNLGPCCIGGQVQPKGTASGEPGLGS
jgi:hypothetical protein